MALIATIIITVFQAAADSTIVQALDVRDPIVQSALDYVSKKQDLSTNNDFFVLNILSQDSAYIFRISTTDSSGLGEYLYWRMIRPSGFFYFNERLVLVFGRRLDELFSKGMRSKDFPFLSYEHYRPKSNRIYISPIYEPDVYVFQYANSTLTLKSVNMLEVIEREDR